MQSNWEEGTYFRFTKSLRSITQYYEIPQVGNIYKGTYIYDSDATFFTNLNTSLHVLGARKKKSYHLFTE